MLKRKTPNRQDDKRAEIRIPISLTVNIRCNGKVFSGQTQNVSKYGMYIEAIDFFGKKNREISIMMAADNTLHRLEGEIVWINRKSSKNTQRSFRALGVRLTEAQVDYLNYIEYLKHDTQFVH
jgi:hypothetical protein